MVSIKTDVIPACTISENAFMVTTIRKESSSVFRDVVLFYFLYVVKLRVLHH